MSPERQSRPAGNGAAYSVTQGEPHSTGVPRQAARHRAAVRLHHRRLRLNCGCREVCHCTQPPLSEKAIDGWRDAAQHVLDAGQMPVVPIEVRRALWRRGGDDRALAEVLHRGCGEVAS